MTAAATKRAKGKAAQAEPELNPEEFLAESPTSKPNGNGQDGPPPGLYPAGAKLFSFKSKSTGETIWFPTQFESPKAVWIWALYDKPPHVQTWEWMRHANIPKLMQRKAVEIMDADPSEYMDLFNQWLDVVGGVSPGE